MQQISDWNKIRDEVHENAVRHGFWDNNPSNEHFLCLVISELMEAVEADRKSMRTDKSILPHFKNPEEYSPTGAGYSGYFEMYVKNTVEDELADAIIRICDLAGANGINLNVPETPIPMFPEAKSSFTENIYQIIQKLVDENRPLDEALNLCRKQICKLAVCLEIDLSWHIEKKMLYNTLRKYKHGKSY